MEITNIKCHGKTCIYDWLADLDGKIIDADKLSSNDEWNYWKQYIYKKNQDRKSLFKIREKTLLDISNRSLTNDISVLKELLDEANKMRDNFYLSKDWNKKEKKVSNNLGEELWLENFEVLSFKEKIEQMNSLINTIQTKIEHLQSKEEPQPEPQPEPKPEPKPEPEGKELIPDKTAIDGLYKFNPKDNGYMYKYLNELGEALLINKECKKLKFGAICLVLYDRKMFFCKKYSELVNSLSRYWGIEPPRDKRPNKYRKKAEVLKGTYSILERDLF